MRAARAQRFPRVFLLLLLLLVLAAGAGPAPAAHVTAIDEGGANDVPGQRDLTRHTVDDSGLPTSMQVSWNWDTVAFSGSNTGDACTLFDADDDGMANFALCVTIGQNPAVEVATRLFTCGDGSADRCTVASLVFEA